jgi:hypothetical protein
MMRRLRLESGGHLVQYAVLTAFMATVLYSANGYISAHLAGTLITFSTDVIGTSSGGDQDSGSSWSNSSGWSDTKAIGDQQVLREGGGNSDWHSASGYIASHPAHERVQ